MGIQPVPNQEDGTVDINYTWKKNLLISWSLLQAGVVVSVLPVHWVLPSITFLLKIFSGKNMGSIAFG